MLQHLLVLITITLACHSLADELDYQYSSIDRRYTATALNSQQVKNAKMQGECLVDLKALNFKRADTFDAIAEWTSYRSVSLLEQYSPCEVLIMMETAKGQLSSK